MIDLHMHSTASDGTDTPAEIVKKCRKLNLSLCSITDHDTVDSQPAALLAARESGARYLTGVEFSVTHEGELHILGYGVDVFDEPFKQTMEELRAYREGRVVSILEKLRAAGIDLPMAEVRGNAGGNTLGRPHIAMALVRRGCAADLQEAFSKYLNEGGKAYVSRRKLSAEQAVGLILSAGGTPVLAHPKFIRTGDFNALAAQLTAYGLAGIEAYYPAHTDADVARFLKVAKEFGLLVTAGSDYHGKMREYSAIASEKRGGPELRASVDFLTEKYCR